PPAVYTYHWPPSKFANGRTSPSDELELLDSYASHRPSGEAIPLRSWNFVCSGGVTRCVPSRASCSRSRPIIGVGSLNTSAVPSGVIPVRNWALLLVVSRSAAPVPSAACHQRLGWPSWFALKTTRRPSGVQRGNW